MKLKTCNNLEEFLASPASYIELDLKDKQIDYAGVTALAESLQDNNTLNSLNLEDNQIDDAGVTALAESLKGNNTLTWLKLIGNNITKVGATALAASLKDNHTLNSLNLEDNQIDGVGAAGFLKGNNALTYLNLTGNKICNTADFAASLKDNNTLTDLDLEDNQIDDAGVTALAESLKGNNTLTWLNLKGNNNITNIGATALAESLKDNYTLTDFDFYWGLGGIEYIIDKIIIRNKKITYDTVKTALESITTNEPENVHVFYLKYYQSVNPVIFKFDDDLQKNNLQHNKINDYINNNFFRLTVVTKSIGKDLPQDQNQNIWANIASYLKLSDVVLDRPYFKHYGIDMSKAYLKDKEDEKRVFPDNDENDKSAIPEDDVKQNNESEDSMISSDSGGGFDGGNGDKIYSKHYDIDMCEADLENYSGDVEQFIRSFIQDNTGHRVDNDNDVLSLILNCAVVLAKEEIIKQALAQIKNLDNDVEVMQILAAVDDTYYSPLSSVLRSGESEILTLFKEFIAEKLTDATGKVFLREGIDKKHLLSAIEFPQFEDISPSTYLDCFLRPVYAEESLTEIIGLVDQMEGAN